MDYFQYSVLIIVTMGTAIVLSFLLRKLIAVVVKRLSSSINTDPTNYSFLKNSISFIVFSLALYYIFQNIPPLKALGTALFAGAGVLAAIVGFASQKAFSNIISGVFILIFKPFRVGDIVESANLDKGVVEEITLRHIIIRNYENRRVVIPNSIVSEEVLMNSSMIDERVRKHVVFGISYDSNIDKAIAIIQDEARQHPDMIDVRTQEEIDEGRPDVDVRVISLDDFSVSLKAYVWATDNDKAFSMQCELLKSVKERFDREGIEIPFPYRTIVYKKDIPRHESSDEKNAN